MGEAAVIDLDDEEERPWGPQPGPQMAFAKCDADIAIFGGAAGGGKSFALLYEAVKWTVEPEVRRYRAILFRRTSPELVGGGGLWDESQAMYRAFGGRPRGMPALDWTFDAESERISDRHRIEFRHLLRETTVHEHQGRQYAFIGFDELTHFSAAQFWYMVSRLRSTCGVRPYVRGTCNPDPDSFVAKLIEWWIGDDGYPIPERSGRVRWLVRGDDEEIEWYDSLAEARAAHPSCLVTTPDRKVHRFESEAEALAAFPDAVHALRATRSLRGCARLEFDREPMSFTFIASRLKDNVILTEGDPSYRAKLMSMGRVDRARLLGDEERGGNWAERASSGLYFRRADFRIADAPPSRIVRTVRAWDKGASVPTPKHPHPDWTRGVRISICEGGEFWIDDLRSARLRPVEVLKLMRAVAEGGVANDGEELIGDGVSTEIVIWQDTAGPGKTDADVTIAFLEGFAVHAVESFGADTTGTAKPRTGSSRAKRAFAKVWAPMVEHGRFYLRRAAWNSELTGEADAFPNGRFDDIVDAISAGVQVLAAEQGTSLLEAMEKVRIR